MTRRVLQASFHGRRVEVQCNSDRLAAELGTRLAHVVGAPLPAPGIALLRVVLDELDQPSWIEVRDSTGRCERGSFDHALYYARKWITAAFVGAHPHLLWLHAAAATRGGSAVILAGPAGAGKSTLVVRLLERAWLLLADDAVALRSNRWEALPLPFTPEARTPRGVGQDWRAFLEQPKMLAAVPPERVARKAVPVGAIVFPEYSSDVDRPVLAALTVVGTAQVLASQCLHFTLDRAGTLASVFSLARQVPCYRLRYSDSEAAVVELTRRWLRGCGRCRD